MGGSRVVRARAAVDLPVPRRPQIKTPPIAASMALRMRASRILCCPTMALNGNGCIFLFAFQDGGKLPLPYAAFAVRSLFMHHGLVGCVDRWHADKKDDGCMLSHG